VASITIRNLDEQTKARLRLRAAHRKRSMEEEARSILHAAPAGEAATAPNLAEAIRRRFQPPSAASSSRSPRASPCASRQGRDRGRGNDRPRHQRLVGADETGARRGRACLDRGQPATSLYTTNLTQAELLHGIALLPPGRRRDTLEAAAGALFSEDFGGRILPYGSDAARPYAHIAVARRRAGRPISQLDAQIAAIARSMGATLATRDTAGYKGCGVKVVNPWEG
jgi:plasmid stability protein/predicted nucleic acid-binding protein